MKKVYMTVGLPGSGKSTWAKKKLDEQPHRYKRINKDDLRAMLDHSHWSDANEKFVLRVRDTLILMALESGKHVIVDDTNLHPKHERQIRELIKGQAELEIVDFRDVPVDVCIERDLKRQNSVGERIILSMYNEFLAPLPPEKLPVDPNLPNAIICDLDGTLALLGRRNPYDAAHCEEDTLNEPIRSILLAAPEDKILLVSGRQDQYKPQTERWLATHNIRYDALIMRKTGDMRKDSIIKQEIFENEIRDHYNIRFVLDDRNSVVEMWRSVGLTCLQVAPGNF
ncbi:MAG: AAA family ATPase [Anaerolineae bacterium]|nr:AAA family ATPase [Gloeobacterales cyanobacterium ES-bin-313]